MFKRVLLVLLTLSAWVPAARAATFVVGVESTEYAPYYVAKGGQWTGYARDVLDAFAKAHGHTLTYQPMPVKRLLSEFLKGSVDFKFPDNPYWAQNAKAGHNIVYSDPVAPYIDGVMVLPERRGKGMAGLKTLGTVLGFTAWDYLDAIKAGKVRLRENTSMKGLLKMAIAGKVDGVYLNPVVARYQLREMSLPENALVFDPDLPHTRSAYHLSTIRHPEVIEQFNTFLNANKALIEQLRAKHGIHLD